MDTTAALFSLSLLLLVGVYCVYWGEGRRRGDGSKEAPAKAKPSATKHTA